VVFAQRTLLASRSRRFFSAVHHTPIIVHCRFMFDGNALKATQTPEELDMCDDDMIDACLFQVGGAWPLLVVAPAPTRCALRGEGCVDHR
jgi:hypothetical protein